MAYHFRKIRQDEVVEYIKLNGRVYQRFATSKEEMEKVVNRYTRILDDNKVFPIGAFDENEKLVSRVLNFDYLINFWGCFPGKPCEIWID